MKRGKYTIAVPPGETIKEYLEMRGMTIKDLSIGLGCNEEDAGLLLEGEVPLGAETAQKIEALFNVPADVWLNMEKLYRSDLVKVERELEAERRKARRARR